MGVFILVLFTLLLSNPNTSFIESELSGYISIAIFYHIARSFAPLAGLVINPALTLALAVQYAVRGSYGSLANCWVWLLGDLLGCLLATLFYTHVYEPIIKEIREIKRKS
jgi:glycerol uptake facilitator-like aquaporin